MAYSTLPTQSAGQTASAAGWANLVKANFEAIGNHYRIRKTATELVTSSTTLQDDDHLKFPIAANEVWLWQAVASVTCNATGGFKYTFTVPAGATGHWNYRAPPAAGNAGGPAFGVTTNHTVTLNSDPHDLSGLVVNGATPGFVTFQWAQQISSGTSTQVLIDSFLIAHQVA